MTTTSGHTALCIERVKMSIADNNLDTLVELGVNERTAGRGWCASNRVIDNELEAGYTAGTLSRPTDELAAEWLANGNATCRSDCEA